MYKGFPSSSQTTNEFLSPIFFGHFRVDSLILKPPCKGELPTGSGCLPKKKSPVTCRWISSFFFGGTKENPIFGFSWSKKHDIFSDFFVGRFFSTTIMVSKNNERTSHLQFFQFSQYAFISKRDAQKTLMFCSTYLHTFLPCFMFEVWDQILIHRVRFLLFEFFGGIKILPST